ncbi:MAG TPA: membrane protein insertion efficiency factor YidD [Planctomycetota bacterium]|nr:membrane protein insertion efficiency factor YidD [Planctomycetota bacterium]
MTRILVRLVDFYRAFISPLLPPLCRFEPSCSAYAREALLRHGSIKGTLLAVWRVLRCNPLCKGGLDPVPPRGRWSAHP